VQREIERGKFMQVVEVIRKEFPNLHTELALEHPHVEVMLTIPAQTGLKFEVSINLQNCDELHLNAGSFWCEWFPCRKQEVCDQFIDALRGLLSGSYRIIEHFRRGKAVKAELQRPENGNWQNVAVWSKVSFSLPWGKSTQILQNR
jgi:hypothetical protein